ncbi:MAG: hypothetical protein JW723_13625 [Bacteroidales bacterium]|nr:hypothetical protein [Bacteroidales bacterium]
MIGFTLLLVMSGCSKDDDPFGSESFYDTEKINEVIIKPQEDRYELFEELVSTMDKESAIDSVLHVFLLDTNVLTATAGEQGITVRYKNGLLGGIMVDPMDNPDNEEPFLTFLNDLMKKRKSTEDLNNSQNTVPGSKKAIFLNPSYWERSKYADPLISNYNVRLQNIEFEQPAVYKNQEATLDRFASLSDYGLIHIYSHGMAWPSTNKIDSVYLLTGQQASQDIINKYVTGFREKDIAIFCIKNKNEVFISPQFITKHNDFKESTPLIYGGFCFSGLGNWPEIMTDTGNASGYFGFDWSVFTSWNAYWNYYLIQSLTDLGNSSANSAVDWYTDDLDKYYWDEKYARNVNIIYWGNPALALIKEEESDIPFTQCSLEFRFDGQIYEVSDWGDSYLTGDTTFWGNTRFLSASFTGSFSGNTFNGSYLQEYTLSPPHYPEGSSELYKQDITVELGNSQNEILSLNWTSLYQFIIENEERSKTEISFSAESIPLSGMNAASQEAVFEVKEAGSCNSFTGLTYYDKKYIPGSYLITKNLVGYRCNEFSYIRVEFK